VPYGDNPQGSMFIDAAGNYSVIVITSGKAKSIAYFGTYTVDDADSSMTMHIQGNSRPGVDGRDQKRIISFSGDEMVQTNAAAAGPRPGVKVTWKRAG
jgi:Lipocalin-like domain